MITIKKDVEIIIDGKDGDTLKKVCQFSLSWIEEMKSRRHRGGSEQSLVDYLKVSSPEQLDKIQELIKIILKA